ncbi:MAG: fluoride efflux transporter CrcB [Candidatus Nanopelagicales bacterium]
MTSRAFGADELGAVAVGGVLGALARWAIAEALPRSDAGAWPWATFLTNLLGCLALGLLLAWVESRHDLWARTRPRRARLARPLLASGVLGGFTTFSTFSVETVELVDAGRAVAAVAYVALSVLLGVLLVLVGRAVGGAASGGSVHDVREDEDL